MHIGVILDQHFPPDQRVENEINLLLKSGHEVSLFSLSRTSGKDSQNVAGIKVYYYNQSWLLYKLSALVYTLPFYTQIVSSKIKDFVNRTKPDVLHVHDMIIAEAAFRANTDYSLPVILDLHENRPEIMKMYKHVTRFPGKYLISLDVWKRKQRELVQKADYTVVVTEEAKQEIVKQGSSAKSVITVPNTIDKETFLGYSLNQELLNRLAGYFNVLYVGETSLRRGTDTAIKAVSVLKEYIPNLRLLLVGQSSQDKLLKKLVTELDVTEHVCFEGWQDLSLFPSYIHSSEICLSPLKRNLHHDTTYANKLFKYMAIGRPVIVSDCPAQSHVVEQEQCGLTHEAGNEQELADRILRLYKNKELRNTMGNNGQEAVQHTYHWANTGQTLIELYQKINEENGEVIS